MSTKCQRVLLKIKLFPESLKKLSLLNSHIILHNIVTKLTTADGTTLRRMLTSVIKAISIISRNSFRVMARLKTKKNHYCHFFPLNNIPELLLGKSQHMKKVTHNCHNSGFGKNVFGRNF